MMMTMTMMKTKMKIMIMSAAPVLSTPRVTARAFVHMPAPPVVWCRALYTRQTSLAHDSI
eukprot:714428-Rhodomonas_salina.1